MPVVLNAVKITGNDREYDRSQHDHTKKQQRAGGNAVVEKPDDRQSPEAELRGTRELVRLEAGLRKIALLVDGGFDRELVRHAAGGRTERERWDLRHQYRILGSATA